MGTTTSILGRLKVVHPDMGYDGGVALEGHVKSTLTKISDAINSRYFVSRDLANGASVDFEHNFKCAFSELRVLLFNIDGSDELTRIENGGTPDLADFTIVAKIGSTTTHITVTNGTGSEQDIAIVLIQGKGAEVLNDLEDVDTTGSEDGQALVYDLATLKYKPGASGDSSFKFQSINSGGTALVIKGGGLQLWDGRILYAASDLTHNVSTLANSDGDWAGFIDLYSLGSSSIVAHKQVYVITTANFVYFKKYFDDITIDQSRYIPCGGFDRTGGVYSGVYTAPFRRYNPPLGADASLVDSLDWTVIGAVGDASQINSGHVLAASSFPAAAIGANLSWYNLADMLDASGNGRTLTNNNSATFAAGIMGIASSAVSLNGSNQYLSTTDALFDPGNTNFCFGCWVKSSNWATVSGIVASQVVDGTLYSYFLQFTPNGVLAIRGTITGASVITVASYDVSSITGLHHVTVRYTAVGNIFDLFIDGIKVSSGTLGGNLQSCGASRKFNIGSYGNGSGGFFGGTIDEFFFYQGTLTDNDILKIQSSKYAHNKGLASNCQDWKWWIKTATDAERPIDNNPIVSQTANELFFDLSGEASTAYVSRKLFNVGQSGLSKPSRGQTLILTAAQMDALLPISHGLGVVPTLMFQVWDGTSHYLPDDGSAFKVNDTTIALADGTLTSLYGGSTNLILTYSSGIPTSFVPNRFWNKVTATAAVALSVNDRLFADTATTGAFTATLPASPSVGDEIQWVDARANFATANLTIGRNGNLINGVAENYDCQEAGIYKALYVSAQYGWAVTYVPY